MESTPADDTNSVAPLRRLFAYCDEAVFEAAAGQTYGTGLLLTEQPIQSDLIEGAMAALAADPDRNAFDEDTLKRGFFHASEDSKNAHSHLCRAIVSSLEGYFAYENTRSGPSLFVRHRKARAASDEDHFKATFSFALLHATQHALELDVVVERRGANTVDAVERAIDNLYASLERSVYDQPNIPASFPRCQIRIAGKNEPGLQVVDFILWASNRAAGVTSDPRWRDRLKSTMAMTHSFDGTPESGGDMIFKKLIRRQVRMYPAAALPVGEPEGNDFWEAVALAERMLHYLASIELPSHVEHLVPRLKAVTEALQATSIASHETMEEAARLFVRLFDTVPIGEEHEDPSVWKKMLMAKRMAALRLRKDLVHGVRSAGEARWWRKAVLDEAPRSPLFFPAPKQPQLADI